MHTTTKDAALAQQTIGADFFARVWEESWTYIKTVVDVVHEPMIILDQELRVLVANEAFYRKFQVEAKDTEKRIVYELGNGQWDIPALRKLLEDILPKNSFFKGFEVSHNFPVIGKKVMILNARQLHFQETTRVKLLPPIILLAFEDVTDMMAIAETLASHTNILEEKLMKKTQKLETYIEHLEKEVEALKKKT